MNEQLHAVEQTLVKWYAGVPHLPLPVRTWIADNAWWLAIIRVVLAVLGMLALIPILLITFGFSGIYGVYGNYQSTASFGLGWLGLWLSLVSLIVTTLLTSMAISPLKVKAKRGWYLIFLALLIDLAISILSAVLTFNPFGVITALLPAAIGGYFLFEIRDQFGSKVVKKQATLSAEPKQSK